MKIQAISRAAIAIFAAAATALSPAIVSAEPTQDVPSVTIEAGSLPPEFDENDQIWMREYIIFSPTGTLYFDEQKALSDGLSAEKLEKIRAMNDIAAAFAPASERDWGDVGEGPFRGYKFCGRGNFGWDEEPVNTLDELCMYHDLCYDNRGYDNCNCDQEFIDRISERKDEMGFVEKRQAEGAQAYFLFRIHTNQCTQY